MTVGASQCLVQRRGKTQQRTENQVPGQGIEPHQLCKPEAIRELICDYVACAIGLPNQAGSRAAPAHLMSLKTPMVNSSDEIRIVEIALESPTTNSTKSWKPHSTVTSITNRTRKRNPESLFNQDSPSDCQRRLYTYRDRISRMKSNLFNRV